MDKGSPTDNVIRNPSRSVSTRRQLQTDAMCVLREEVYVSQPEGFIDQDHPNYVYRPKKALYGLKQAPRAWYDLMSKFLLSQKFSKGDVDPTLFTRKEGKDILLYLKGTVNMGLWYPKNTDIKLTAYADADHAGCQDTRQSTSGSA
ncbi:retrovirus-related pol polyprotein from transposon TNT 1-94 [Tanacetum coccineum]